MGEFLVRVATPADVDRLWPLFDETDRQRVLLWPGLDLKRAERRRAQLVSLLLDLEHPVLVAYSGIRAVGYQLLPFGTPYVSESWRGLGVEAALMAYLA
jgi:hypothetical protein